MNAPVHILVVEDNPLVAKFFRMALERAGGYTVEVTEDVPAILEAIQSGRVALLLADVSLTSARWDSKTIDGIELAQLARQHAPRPLPIMIATAHARQGDRERILEASGADDLIEKPIYDAQALVDRVRKLIAAGPSQPSAEVDRRPK